MIKKEYIRKLENNMHLLGGLLACIDNRNIEVLTTRGEIGDICYAEWGSEKGIAFHTLVKFLVIHHFDDKLVERCEYVRQCWQSVMKQDFKKTLFIYSLTSSYYEHTIKDFIETYTDDMGYKQKRFKSTVNPKEIGKLHSDFLIYMAICEFKYGRYNHMKSYNANIHLGFAKQIDAKIVNQLKKFGTGDIPKETLIYKTDTISCTANDIYANVSITLKEESEANFKQALNYLLALMRVDSFPKSYSLKYRGTEKLTLPIKSLPKKPPHFFFAKAIQFVDLHPLIEEYATLMLKETEEIWYENTPDENPAKTGTFAVFALGLADKKYLELVADYLQKVDYEHQHLQENYIPVLVEKYGLDATTHNLVIAAITQTDNFKYNKALAKMYTTPNGIKLLKDTELSTETRETLYCGLFKTKIPKTLQQ